MAIVVLGVVLSGVYSLFLVGFKAQTVGGNLSVLQRDLNFASSFITREVRNTLSVSLLSTDSIPNPTSTTGNGFSYIFLDDDKIKHVEDGKIKNVTPLSSRIEALTFRLAEEDGRAFLHFTATASKGGQSKSLETKVLLNNVKNTAASTREDLSLVRYKKP